MKDEEWENERENEREGEGKRWLRKYSHPGPQEDREAELSQRRIVYNGIKWLYSGTSLRQIIK